MHTVYLLLGSNKGHRLRYLLLAQYLIGRDAGEVTAASRVYETAPWGVQHKTGYLNRALEIRTALTPFQLMRRLQKTEKQLGRKNKNMLAARTIDIDILLYDAVVFESGNLQIPHPRLHLRNFTLQPLAELAKSYTHPILGTSIEDLAKNCADTGKVAIFAGQK